MSREQNNLRAVHDILTRVAEDLAETLALEGVPVPVRNELAEALHRVGRAEGVAAGLLTGQVWERQA